MMPTSTHWTRFSPRPTRITHPAAHAARRTRRLAQAVLLRCRVPGGAAIADAEDADGVMGAASLMHYNTVAEIEQFRSALVEVIDDLK